MALVWMRVTQASTRKRDGVMIKRLIQRELQLGLRFIF